MRPAGPGAAVVVIESNGAVLEIAPGDALVLAQALEQAAEAAQMHAEETAALVDQAAAKTMAGLKPLRSLRRRRRDE